MSTIDPEVEHLPSADAPAPEQGIDLFAVVVAILSEWRLAVLAFLAVALACFFFILSLKPQYVANASFLPQEGRNENGLAALFSNRGPGTLYIGLLRSRTVQDSVIEHAGLMQLFHSNSVETARDQLSSISSFAEGGDTLVTIAIKDGNAQDAARIANAYLDALKNLNQTMGLEQSVETTKFFRSQLQSERDELATAESDLERTQRQTGIVSSDTQTQAGLGAIAAARSQISGLEVQRAALLHSETEENPQVKRLDSQIAQLRADESRMEGSGTAPLGAPLAAGQMPKNNLDMQRAQREVKYHDLLVTSLANQFEAAKLNQLFARSAFQVVDYAVAPERKAWPPRKPFFLISLVFAAICGIAAVASRLTWKRLMADPEHRASLKRLGRAFGSR